MCRIVITTRKPLPNLHDVQCRTRSLSFYTYFITYPTNDHLVKNHLTTFIGQNESLGEKYIELHTDLLITFYLLEIESIIQGLPRKRIMSVNLEFNQFIMIRITEQLWIYSI